MKKYLCITGAWVALAAITASGQTSGSGQGTSGTSQGTTSSSQGTTTSQGNQQNLPPGSQNKDQLPPGLQNREQLPSGLANRTNNVSNFATTNQNQFGGTPRFGTNGSGLYPTGRGSDTNRMYGTNRSSQGSQQESSGANNRDSRTGHQDQAVTAQDRTLLITVRQKVQTEVRALASSSAGTWAPVNFKCDQGVVTILGTVQSVEIKQQIENCVRRVPGVVRVENTIEIAGAGGVGAGVGGDSDQVLITRVRQKVSPEIRVSGLDFQCHGGVVTVIGSVPQPETKERLIALVRQVPGVVNVTDQVTVGGDVQGQTRLGQPEQTRLGQPQQTREGQTERDKAVSAAIETSKTNLPPTGRENLPPGLDEPSSRRTNNATQPRP